MPYATLLYHLRWRKKKADFIIPPTYFRRSDYSIVEAVESPKSKIESPILSVVNSTIEVPKVETISVEIPKVEIPEIKSEENLNSISENNTISEVVKLENSNSVVSHAPKVSAFSLASIKAKKELMESQKGIVKIEEHLPTEVFTETEMLEFWYKYAQRLNDKGHMIMESLLRISTPKLDGFRIVYELPNEGSKIDFDKEKPELLGYLRGHLHNHDISIEVIVNEKVKVRTAFTPQDKYNRLKEINPNLELFKKIFDLDI